MDRQLLKPQISQWTLQMKWELHYQQTIVEFLVRLRTFRGSIVFVKFAGCIFKKNVKSFPNKFLFFQIKS